MPTLLLLRHAKLSWADSYTSDHERPLAPRGVHAVSQIAAHLSEEMIHPTLVLCSTARRTRDTLDAIRPALGDSVDVRFEDGLYGADADDILHRLRRVDEAIESVMVVGHNPGLEDLALDLAGDGDETALAQLHTKFPTGALATLDLRSTWAGLAAGGASLRAFVVPRQLG